MERRKQPPYPLELGQSAPPDGLVYFTPKTVIYPETHSKSGFMLREHLFALAITSNINGLSGFLAITSASGIVSYNGHNGTVHIDERFGAYANKVHKYR